MLIRFPLKITKLPNVGSSSTRQRNAISMAFSWWDDDVPLIVVFASFLQPKKKLDPLWQNFLDPRMARGIRRSNHCIDRRMAAIGRATSIRTYTYTHIRTNSSKSIFNKGISSFSLKEMIAILEWTQKGFIKTGHYTKVENIHVLMVGTKIDKRQQLIIFRFLALISFPILFSFFYINF